MESTKNKYGLVIHGGAGTIIKENISINFKSLISEKFDICPVWGT